MKRELLKTDFGVRIVESVCEKKGRECNGYIVGGSLKGERSPQRSFVWCHPMLEPLRILFAVIIC